MEGSSHVLLYQHLLEGTEEDHGNLSQDSRCPGQDSNQSLLEYM
jgi:hypothetical protein